MVTWLLLRTGARSAAENMAVDDVLLHSVAKWRQPVLRFYSWSERAASFGYFQKYKDVEKTTVLRPLVRRPTGGGLVPHDADWTYSVSFSPGTEWYGLKAVESYERVHAWIRDAFAKIGVGAELAEAQASMPGGQCFAGAEQFDVMLNNHKIAGAAQRRTKHGLLIQGSIQPPAGIKRADWETAFLDVGSLSCEPLALSAEFEEQIQNLAARKYAQPSYNERR